MAAEFLQTHGIDLQYEMSKIQFGESSNQPSITTIKGCRLPSRDPDSLWDINIRAGKISTVTRHESIEKTQVGSLHQKRIVAEGQLLAPSLCHPHIHLDKCFLLYDSKYFDLEIIEGSFAEALELTKTAKSRFEEDDLLRRARWLMDESIAAGVTCMRALVEVDSIVHFKCRDTALKLKAEFRDVCELQVCAFAQEPVLSGAKGTSENARIMEEALTRDGVDVLGSTPYVEECEALMRANIEWAISTAMKYEKHLDLHLDYHLDPKKQPLVDFVIEKASKANWTGNQKDKTIVLGHCTRLSLLTSEEWQSLSGHIADLPIHFIGLPNSDIFMMGRPDQGDGGGPRMRGTLQVPEMIQRYNLMGAIGINHIGNAFTPQGNCDPMSIASMGVGLYHAGTKQDTAVLFVRSCRPAT